MPGARTTAVTWSLLTVSGHRKGQNQMNATQANAAASRAVATRSARRWFRLGASTADSRKASANNGATRILSTATADEALAAECASDPRAAK